LNTIIKEDFLKLNPILKEENVLQIDKYFWVKNHIEWKDCVLRIRNNNDNEFLLAFKWKSVAKSWDIAWPEWENKIDLITKWYVPLCVESWIRKFL
jgi:hypothetical protein